MTAVPVVTRFDATFARLRSRGEGLLMPFLPLGYPTPEETVALCDALVEAGADALELGLPFSDPTADGPTLQRASEQALANGATFPRCLALLAEVRRRHPSLPIAVLTYANLTQAQGLAAFYGDLSRAGVDAVVLADVPVREAAPFTEAAASAGVAQVLLAAPNSPERTLRAIAERSQAFTYVVARRGVTGARSEGAAVDRRVLDALEEAGAPPAIVGFGLSRPEHVRQVLLDGAPGAIVGSALVEGLAAPATAEGRREAVGSLVRELKAATLPRETTAGPALSPASTSVQGGDVRTRTHLKTPDRARRDHLVRCRGVREGYSPSGHDRPGNEDRGREGPSGDAEGF